MTDNRELSFDRNIREGKKSLGLYIHIPFCKQKCLYCDFCSLARDNSELKKRYLRSLSRSIEKGAERARGYEVDTIYIGGGTPTVLEAGELCGLIDVCYKNYSIAAEPEISCECNPATASRKYFHDILLGGINRLSIGMQSSHENELSALGRIHSYGDFVRTYHDARDAGFSNISADLMYGIPQQSVKSFECTLERLCDLDPDHISAYCLKVEQETPFGRMGDKLILPDEDEQYEMYMFCSEYLTRRGYQKYEISNFAKPGYESRHNLRYWIRSDYIGFGSAAHSCFESERFSISPNVSSFADGEWIETSRERIDDRDAMREYVMLRMRLEQGVKFSDFRDKFGAEFLSEFAGIQRFAESGHVTVDERGCRFTDKGFFVSSYILSEILDFD